MAYTRDRNFSLVGLQQRLRAQGSQDDKTIASWLQEGASAFEDVPSFAGSPSGSIDDRLELSPITEPSTTFSEDEHDHNQTVDNNDDSDDDVDPSALFWSQCHRQHIVIDGRSYAMDVVPTDAFYSVPLSYNPPDNAMPHQCVTLPPQESFGNYYWSQTSPLDGQFGNPFLESSSEQHLPTLPDPDTILDTNPSSPVDASPASLALPLPSPPQRVPKRSASHLVLSDDEDNSASEDEYRPSPPPSPKRQRHSPPTTKSRPSSSKSRTSKGKRPQNRQPSTSTQNGNGLSRNIQTDDPMIWALKRGEDVSAWLDSLNFVCPVPGCTHITESHRMPDFQRHLTSHCRGEGLRCKGVLLTEMNLYPEIPADAQTYMFEGEERVGGCMNTFSRKDALNRHLKNPKGTCVSSRG